MAIHCVRPTAEVFYGLSLFTFAFNVIALPQLVQQKVCQNKYNSTICIHLQNYPHIENDVQASAAKWMSIVPLSALLPALFTILMIGPISDVIGKKRTMIIPPTFYFLQSLVFVLLTRITVKFSPGFFLLAYCLSGIFGDNSGCALLSEAYISCVTTKANRTVRLAMLESALFLGQVAAAISSGLIISNFGFTGGFVATAIVNFANLVYVVFLLPPENLLAPSQALVTSPPEIENEKERIGEGCSSESRRSYLNGDKGEQLTDNRSTFEKLNPLACLRRISEALCTRQRRKRSVPIMVLFSIATFVNMGEIYLGVLFLKHSPFSLDPKGLAYIIAFQGILRSIGLVIIPYICQVFFKVKDIHIVILGFCTQIVYFTVFGLSTSVLMVYLAQLLSIPMAVHLAIFRSMVSKLVDADQYGAAIAAVEAVSAASALFTSLISNQIYSLTVHIFAGFTVELLGIIAISGLIGAVIYSLIFKEREMLSEEQQHLLTFHQSESNNEIKD